MLLVEQDRPGFRVSRKLDKLGMRASDTAELAFEDCPVPAENLLGVEGRGFHQLAAGLQRERILAAVLALSGAGQALEDTMAYLRERVDLRRAARRPPGPPASPGRPGHRGRGGPVPRLSRGRAPRRPARSA